MKFNHHRKLPQNNLGPKSSLGFSIGTIFSWRRAESNRLPKLPTLQLPSNPCAGRNDSAHAYFSPLCVLSRSHSPTNSRLFHFVVFPHFMRKSLQTDHGNALQFRAQSVFNELPLEEVELPMDNVLIVLQLLLLF